MKPGRSLRVKLIASFAAVICLAVSAIMLYIYVDTKAALTQREVQMMQQELRAISDKVTSYLDKIKLIPAFAYEDSVQQMLTRAPEETPIQAMTRLINFREFYYKRLASLNIERELQDIYFIYPDGEVLHKGFGIYDAAYDFTAAPWYQRAVEGRGRAVLIDTHAQTYNIPDRYDPQRGELCLGMAIAVMRYDADELLGVLLMDIRLDEISRILEPLLLGQNSRVFFASEAGEVLYDTAGEELLGRQLPQDIRLALTDNSGSFSAQMEGQGMTVTYLKSQETGWWLVNVNPTALILADVTKLLGNVLWVVLAAFMATVVLAAAFSHKIFEPLEKLTRALDRVRTGELNIQIPIRSRDEIGRLAASFNAMSRRLNRLIGENYLIRLREKEAQLETLQSQINPHFLYNTLESINCIAQVNEIREISVISRSLARMLRYSFREGQSLVRVRDELDTIGHYMNIQQIRFPHRIHMETQVQEEVMDAQVPRMTLQPLVENTIRHALERSGQGITLRIAARREGEMVFLGVWDDGPGFPPQRLAEIRAQLARPIRFDRGGAREHIGLNNLNSRLKLYYGEDCGLQVDSREGAYTHVYFRVPLRRETPRADSPQPPC